MEKKTEEYREASEVSGSKNAIETMRPGFLPCGDKGILIIIPGMPGFLLAAGRAYGQKKAVGFFLYRKFWQKWKNDWSRLFTNDIFHVT